MSSNTLLKLEEEYVKDKEIEELKKKNELLEKELEELKNKEIERSKLNLEVECLCLFTNTNGGTVIFGEEENLKKLNLINLRHEKCVNNSVLPWGGNGLHFLSLASARTCLFRNGYKLSYVSEVHHVHNQTFAPVKLENWVKGL